MYLANHDAQPCIAVVPGWVRERVKPMTYEEALDRVVKLLKLSKSDNPNEAALAAAKAQEIMDRFKLEPGAVNAAGVEEPARPFEAIQKFADPLYGTHFGKNPTWKIRLASTLCAANQCRCFLTGGATFLIGRASDASTVRYLYAFLEREVERLAERDGRGNGRTWINNYRLGVVDTLGKRLHEQRAATREAVKTQAFAQAGESAIVRVNQSIARVEQEEREVRAWEKANMKYGSRRSTSFTPDYGAREAGRKTGHEVRLGAPRGGLASGQS